MLRIARVVIPNYPHHITQRGTNRTAIFLDDEDRRFFLKRLNDFAGKTKTNIWAYCLMDNHFHLLLEPTEQEGLMKCLHEATFRYAQYFNLKYTRSGRLWQNRYFSCIVDKDEYLWAVVRYIENNPVRANMVEKAEGWKWSSAGNHILDTRDDHIFLHKLLSEAERDEYQKFVKSEASADEIRKATMTGRPLGNSNFIGLLEAMLERSLKPKKGGRPKKEK